MHERDVHTLTCHLCKIKFASIAQLHAHFKVDHLNDERSKVPSFQAQEEEKKSGEIKKAKAFKHKWS